MNLWHLFRKPERAVEVNLNANDILVLSVDEPISNQRMETLKRQANELLARGDRVMILPSTIRVSVIHR